MKDTFIALLRGVNVGGARSVLTKDLVRLLEDMGLSNVKTFGVGPGSGRRRGPPNSGVKGVKE